MSVAIAAIWSNLRYVSAVRDDLVYIREDALQISRPQKKSSPMLLQSIWEVSAECDFIFRQAISIS